MLFLCKMSIPRNSNKFTVVWMNMNWLAHYTTIIFHPGVLGIWADTYARFEVWPTHPFIYQNFLPRPIHLPNFCQFLLLNSSIYQNLTLKPINLPFFANFCSWIPSIYRIIRSNLSIYQNFTLFLENDPPIYLHQPFKTHPSTSSIRIHENMWVL